MPKDRSELGECTPTPEEDPFFCLLEDDALITRVSVETDTLLDPQEGSAHELHRVRLVLTVSIRPYYVTMFNLNFA